MKRSLTRRRAAPPISCRSAGLARRLAAEGRLSPVSLVRPFAPMESYPRDYFVGNPWPDVSVLSATHTSHGGTNYHQWGYLAIARDYRRDAVVVAVTHPSTFFRASLRAWASYFRSSSDYFALEPNRSRIAAWRRLYEGAVYGRVSSFPVLSRRGHAVYVFLLLGLPLVFAWGLGVAGRGRAGHVELDLAQRTVVALMCFNIAYVALIVNCLTAGENNRFRFVTDGLSAVLLSLLLKGWRRRREAVVGAPSDPR